MMNFWASLFTFTLIFWTDFVIACPGCAGSSNNEADNYTVYVLMGFIAAIYYPFYLLFKTIIKYKNINSIDEKEKL